MITPQKWGVFCLGLFKKVFSGLWVKEYGNGKKFIDYTILLLKWYKKISYFVIFLSKNCSFFKVDTGGGH
jgi:hypothetical protein